MSTTESNSTDGDRSHKKCRIVLCPIDGSEHSQRAFDFYTKHVKRPHDCVKFVNVIEPAYTSPAIGMAMTAPPIPNLACLLDQSIRECKTLCQSMLAQANNEEEKGVNALAFMHIDSSPGAAIVKSICEHKADLIVIGNRGVGSFRRTFLGSVSEYILSHTSIPTIIVPPPIVGED